MSMVRVVQETLNVPDEPALIRPPRLRLLARLGRQWLGLFGIVLLGNGVLLFVAIPLLPYFFLTYRRLVKQWKRYGYSGLLLHASTAAIGVLSVCLAVLLRTLVAAP